MLSCFSREGNEPGDSTKITYRELLHKVCQFANVLRSQGTRLRQPGALDTGEAFGQGFGDWGCFLCDFPSVE